MEVDCNYTSSSVSMESGGGLAAELLYSDNLSWFLANHRSHLPELIHQAAELVTDNKTKESFLILCGKLVCYSAHLVQHVEPLVLQLTPPWDTDQGSARKRSKYNSERTVELYTSLLWLVRRVRKLITSWSWSGLFVILSSGDAPDVRIICLEILRHLVVIPEDKLQILRNHVYTGWQDVLFQVYASNMAQTLALAKDSGKQEDELKGTGNHVVRLEHVSLPRVGTPHSSLVSTPSTKAALVSMAENVSLARAVLLRGHVGTGKTSLVRELAQMTGRSSTDVLSVQISDSTDARLLLGLYRCTDIPGRFVWEPGMLTRAVHSGSWLCIEDIDRAQQDVTALVASLVQTGKLSVPNLGGSIHPETGFQLFLTERTQDITDSAVSINSDIAKIAKIVKVPELSKEELQQVISKRYPNLETLMEKVLRLYDVVGEEYSNLRSHRQVSLRDLIRWCDRITRVVTKANKSENNKEEEQLYLDAVDCFCKSIPSSTSRSQLSEDIAYILNISKDRASFYTSQYKPQVTLTSTKLQVGRVRLSRKLENLALPPIYSITRHSAVLLESVGRAVDRGEPILLVGETGVGKTASVQFLADQTGRRLRVINMNQQSDSVDLLGGYKPVDITFTMHNILHVFNKAFDKTFASQDNTKFVGHLSTCYMAKRWSDALVLMSHTLKSAVKKLKARSDGESLKLRESWATVSKELKIVSEIMKQSEKTTIFAFIEGLLTRAVKEGHWILLDEVNMANPETLECLSSLLDLDGSVCLYEKGDYQSVVRHPEFRLFACMNPATDTGKHDLPAGLRNRFTELYVDEIKSEADIQMLVKDYLQSLSLPAKQISNIVTFFKTAKTAARTKLTTGTGERPTFSLRTLCRALRVANRNPCNNVTRSLYEGFSLSFLTELDKSSHGVLEGLLQQYIIPGKEVKRLLKQSIPEPTTGAAWHKIQGFWIPQGKLEPVDNERYIMTSQVANNLKDLSRVVALCDHPVLIQGDTSVGKTSLVTYLAGLTGNKCVRVNNHEHTDIQEYVGSYTSDASGKLVFKHGVLTEAMVQGSWVILDELNLAPTDVLEALNRVLDDNRQLYIPETQETITAAPGFRLFGTQNPPGMYGGRKVLSKAFKNRFVELHFNQLPPEELETILKNRCNLPQTYAKKMIAVLTDLQKYRRMSAAFAGKQGFITLRDLFRWAERYRLSEDDTPTGKFYDWEQHIAEEGYLLLAARIRNSDETQVVIEILEKVFKRKVLPDHLFSLHEDTSKVTRPLLEMLMKTDIPGLAWTFDMRRMCVLVAQAWKFNEPVLLVGETGCGKTTAVQVLAKIGNIGLSMLNCHRHTESADFLGGLRPDRGDGTKKSGLNFHWCDGPLVTAMRKGLVFLADEISLADDSVIERLNSVLEPERQVLLAEKIDSNETEVVTATDNFRFVGTMNPGGDYGKKELSPALKNRFTEIWCPSIDSEEQISSITTKNLIPQAKGVAGNIVQFVQWLRTLTGNGKVLVSIRDILAWVNFINGVINTNVSLLSDIVTPLTVQEAFIQGAYLVWLDGLQMDGGSGTSASSIKSFQALCEQKMIAIVGGESNLLSKISPVLEDTEDKLVVQPFAIKKNKGRQGEPKYIFHTKTTTNNVLKILRALQIQKPILLEGSPGIGKSSLVEALAKKIGQPLVRINLSDQTDISDLFGSDLPVEGGAVGQFAWRNGPFLDALQNGDWILLDELNLASQSVLEGLNAVFDHRGEVYIPELDLSFPLNPNTRVFGCQNPLSEGGDRKGLPKSFLNRFSKVYMSGLTPEDYKLICLTLHPDLGQELVNKIVEFNQILDDEIVVKRKWGQSGSPWEFNLRDLLRWCDAMKQDSAARINETDAMEIDSDARMDEPGANVNPGKFVRIIYASRFRKKEDKDRVLNIYRTIFEPEYPLPELSGHIRLSAEQASMGQFSVPRKGVQLVEQNSFVMLSHQRKILECIAGCVLNTWPVILTGLADSGKSSLVQILSTLCSRKLYTISLNSSSDTLDLLGGFEQADVGNSLLELFSMIQNNANSLVNNLIQTDISASLKFLENVLKLTGDFNIATHNEKRKHQMKALQSLILVLEEYDNGDSEQQIQDYKNTLLNLQKNTKHGTFEWMESILCKALKEGCWLVIDNVNLCSASVLDRLNALFEQGGRLTVSERGVLDGQVPEIVPHPDFRVFMLYDPSRGDISRAMRNRGVEIYVPTVNEVKLTEEDRHCLVGNYLGTALGSDSAVSTCNPYLNISNVKTFSDSIALTSLQTLCGHNDNNKAEQGEIIRRPLGEAGSRLCWALTSSSTWSLYAQLSTIITQIQPLVLLSCPGSNEDLAATAFRYFLCFTSHEDKEIRHQCLKLIMKNNSLDDVYEKFIKNKLFSANAELRPKSSYLESRLEMKSTTNLEEDVTISTVNNLMQAIITMHTRFKQLQDKVNQEPRCLLSKSTTSFTVHSPILEKFSKNIMKMLKSLEGCLNESAGSMEVNDESWFSMDSFMFWFFELCQLGLTVPEFDSEDDLERLIYVYWQWLNQRLFKLPQNSNLQTAMEKFDATVQSLDYDCDTFQVFRQSMQHVLPEPPNSPEELALALVTSWLDFTLSRLDRQERLLFIINNADKIKELFESQETVDFSSLCYVTESCCALLTAWLDREHKSAFCKQEDFYNLQLSALKYRLDNLMCRSSDNLTPLSLRLKQADIPGNLEDRARYLLHQATKQWSEVGHFDHSVTADSVIFKLDVEKIPQDLNTVSLVYQIVNRGNGISLVSSQSKEEQMQHITKSLQQFQKRDRVTHFKIEYEEELKSMLSALSAHYGLDISGVDNNQDIPDANIQKIMACLAEKKQNTEFEVNISLLLLNVLKFYVYSSLGAIDPAERRMLEYTQTVKHLDYINSQVQVMERYREHIGTVHPHIPVLNNASQQLKIQIKALVCRKAERPNDSFSRLSNTIKQFRSGPGKVAVILNLVENLDTCLSAGGSSSCSQVEAETKVWLMSSTKFAQDLLSAEIAGYPDLVLPIIESISRCIISVEESLNIVLQDSKHRQLNLTSMLHTLSSPSLVQANSTVNQTLDYMLKNSSRWTDENLRFKVMKSMLILVKECKDLSPAVKFNPSKIKILAKQIIFLWKFNENVKLQRKIDDEALFKQKTTVCEDDDDENGLAAEYSQLFPDFKQDFADITEINTLEDDVVMETDEDADIAKLENINDKFVDEMLKDIAAFMTERFCKTEKLENDYVVKDFLERMKMVCRAVTYQNNLCSKNLEVQMVPSLLSYLNKLMPNSSAKCVKGYNFYLDPNQEEVQLILPIFEQLHQEVNKLLEAFPENSVLIQILKIKNRILEFSLDSPLSKYITGMDMVLQACQEWEKNAHKGVSIMLIMDRISHLLLRWRKLELTNWKSILPITLDNIRQTTLADYTIKILDICFEKHSLTKRVEFVQTIIHFMESATLGDFNARLDILSACSCFLKLAGEENRQWLIAALHNINKYYSTFTNAINAKLESSFKNCDDQIQKFIKMARWKDTNFWSVKVMVDKTRKLLHKVIRAYKKNINLPCRNFLLEDSNDADLKDPEIVVTFAKPERIIRLAVFDDNTQLEIKNLKGEIVGTPSTMAGKAVRLSTRIRKYLKDISFVSAISDLTPEIIKEMEVLQNLDVNRKKSKKDQKKEAGFIQGRKHRALNDLFKTLQGLGLSYRYGIINCANMSTNQELFVLEAGDSVVTADLEKYFFRCWARYRQLIPLLDKKLPDGIGPMLTERFQGFSQHGLQALTDWRQNLYKYTNLLSTLNRFTSESRLLASQDKGNFYPAKLYRSYVDSTIQNLTTVVLVLQDFTSDFPEVEQGKPSLTHAQALLQTFNSISAKAPVYFVSSLQMRNFEKEGDALAQLGVKLDALKKSVESHPVADQIDSIHQKVVDASVLIKQAGRMAPVNEADSIDIPSIKERLSRSLFTSLLGIQNMFKLCKSFSPDDQWLLQFNKIFSEAPKFKAATISRDMKVMAQTLEMIPEIMTHCSASILKELVSMIDYHIISLESIMDTCQTVCREFAKLLSVLIKIFATLAVKGFCPIKGFEDLENDSSNEGEFKSTEEEAGLGDGEGQKDVSDQIENEDMLDGAYDPNEKREEENKDHEEEENGIEMSENFESSLQDKDDEEEQDNSEEKEKEEEELEDEVGEVEGNEELDKEMWGDDDKDDEKEDEDLGESEEQGKTEEEVSEDLSSNDKPDSKGKEEEEKRLRKEEEEEDPEFDDSQVDEEYAKDKEYPEPEPMDLPDDMNVENDENQEEHFEEPEEEGPDPGVQPDFKDDDPPDDDDPHDDDTKETENDEEETTEVDQFGLDDDNPDVETEEKDEENQDSVKVDEEEKEKSQDDENAVAQDENKTGKDSVKNEDDFDKSNKEESEGMSEDSQNKEENKSFNVSSKAKAEEKSDDKAGSGTQTEQQKSLQEDPSKAERLDLVEGNMTGEDGVQNADTFQHIMDKRDDDRSAVDRADRDVKDQIFNQDFEMENEEKDEIDEVKRVKEEQTEQKDTSKGEKPEPGGEDDKQATSQDDKDKDFVDTMNVSRGTDSIFVRQEVSDLSAMSNIQVNFDTSLSLQQITLTDNEDNDTPVLTQLSHSLSEQLRLILNPTKASSLQGDFRTGKRLNMRKIIPFIASDFKKDKIWLRRTKPTKREFQILVALDDSSSMADNKSRQIALTSLNTISSALSLLEAGQLGVLRFGESAEVVHPLNVQWSQTAGHKIQNQFSFDQKKTSVISLMQLATALFHRHRINSSTQTAVSQLLVIISDGRGIFHEGKERVLQSVVNSRCAGYFCLYLIVENPDNKDSVLDIRQPVFNSKGELEGIQSYMDSFPFQHYIIMRDVENLPATLSDALRQWFQMVCSST